MYKNYPENNEKKFTALATINNRKSFVSVFVLSDKRIDNSDEVVNQFLKHILPDVEIYSSDDIFDDMEYRANIDLRSQKIYWNIRKNKPDTEEVILNLNNSNICKISSNLSNKYAE